MAATAHHHEGWLGAAYRRVAGVVLRSRGRALGFLVVVGIALAIWGYDVYDSAGSQISRALDGGSPAKPWIGMIGGAVCVVLGIVRLK